MAVIKDNENIQSFLGATKQLNLAVSMGQVDGYGSIDKFGANDDITGNSNYQTIVGGQSGAYPYSTSADIISLSSSNTGDNQTIRVIGQTADGTEIEQDISLNGRTRVAIDTPLQRVYRMINIDSTDIAGTVYCYSGTTNTLGVPSGASVEKARITNQTNQASMGVYTIPKGKVGFLCRGEVGLKWEGGVFAGTENITLHYRSRRIGGVFVTKKEVTITSGGSSIYKDARSFPDVIPSLTDIEIAKVDASASMGAWATFDILLVDEGKFTTSYLQAIGQPGY